VLFESFIGDVPFVRNYYLYQWTLSEVASLDLPGGPFRAMRDANDLRRAARGRSCARPRGAPIRQRAVRLGVALAPAPVDILKGLRFARHDGIVRATGRSATGRRIRTSRPSSWRARGPVPPPYVPPPPGGTQ
jgi:hypothetical protein